MRCTKKSEALDFGELMGLLFLSPKKESEKVPFQKSSLPSIMGVSGPVRYLCDSNDHINNIDALKQGQQPCSYRVMAGRREPFFTMVVSF